MIVAMQEGATDAQIQHVVDHLVGSGFTVHRSTGERHTVLGAVGVHRRLRHAHFELLDGVERSHRITRRIKLAGRQFNPEGTIIEFSGRGCASAATKYWCWPGRVRSNRANSYSRSRGKCRQSRSQGVARGRVQAAHFAVLISGHGRKGPRSSCAKPPKVRLARCQRSHGQSRRSK